VVDGTVDVLCVVVGDGAVEVLCVVVDGTVGALCVVVDGAVDALCVVVDGATAPERVGPLRFLAAESALFDRVDSHWALTGESANRSTVPSCLRRAACAGVSIADTPWMMGSSCVMRPPTPLTMRSADCVPWDCTI
jgi:hypothetical protein